MTGRQAGRQAGRQVTFHKMARLARMHTAVLVVGCDCNGCRLTINFSEKHLEVMPLEMVSPFGV